ncbi:MAG: T9SS type A sorting domain-containing protein, partial [Bacteroidota bacterium]
TISAPGTSNTPAAIRLNGCSYVTLDSLHIVSTGNDGKYGVMITGVSDRAASNNTIQSCTIENTATTTGFNSGMYGIYVKGYSSSSKDLNNTIKSNTLSTFGQAGIRIENASGTLVESNKIGNWIQTGGGTDIKGIWTSSNAVNTTVRGNIIYGITSLVNGTSVTGIEDSVGTANSNFLCYNNMIYGLGSNGSGGSGNRVRGIFLSGSNQTGDAFYNNSIYLSGSDNSIATVSYATAFEAVTSSTSAFSLKNNIFHNSILHGSSNARSYGIRMASTTVPIANISSNNNLFNIPTNDEQPQGFIGRFTSSDKLTLNDWRTAIGGDANSKTGDPRYLSSSDLHIATTLPKSPAAASGVAIAEVTTDIDGDSRLNPPDIGADEFSVVSKISGKVQEDADGLMSTSNDRTALVGWKVYLNLNGNIVTATTDNSGNYAFGSLSDGSYTVTDSLLATYAPLDISLGSGANSASRVDSSQVLVDISDGDDAINYNLINYRPSTITARVWEDGDGNFATSNDWTAKNWRVSIHRISQNPVTLVNSVDTSNLVNATLGAGTYAVVIADSSIPAWVHIGKKVGTNTFSGSYNVDTVTLAAASSQSIDFVNYLPHTISIRVVEDSDGSFSFTSSDTVGKAWAVNLVSLTGAAVNLSVSSDSNLVNTYLHEGTYFVSQADSTQNEDRLWTHLGIIRDGVRERKIGINSDTVIVTRGQATSIVFVNSRIYPDTTRYRTFLPKPTEWGVKKPITLKAKKGVYPVPSIANVLYTAYNIAYPKGTAMLIGVQMIGFEKTKLWAQYTKAASFTKAFGTEHTGAGGPFVIPTNGKKAPLKDPKYDAVKFNNKLAANLIALKLNMAASDEDVIYDIKDELQYKFGDLLYRGPETTYVDMSLREIALLADTMLTKSEIYATDLYLSITNVLVDANKAFNDPRPLTVADTVEGIQSYGPKTTIKIKATITVDESNPAYFIRDVQPPPRNFSASTAVKLPEVYTLEQNYPNPFNPTTAIEFYLPEDAIVSLKIYNVLGQEVATVLNKEFYEAGNDLVEFDASKFSSGVYFYRFNAKGLDTETDFSSVKKMILMK